MVFFPSGESTIGSKRVSDTGDDYVDLTLDALSLINPKTSLNYAQIKPLELAYISTEEIIRVCLSLCCSCDRCDCDFLSSSSSGMCVIVAPDNLLDSITSVSLLLCIDTCTSE